MGILALPFRPLYNKMSPLSLLLFLSDSYFNCPRMPDSSHSPSFIDNVLSQTSLREFEPFPIHLEVYQYKGPRVPNGTGRTNPLIAASFTSWGAGEKSSPQESKGSVGFSANIADMRIPSQITCSCFTEVFDVFNIYKDCTI